MHRQSSKPREASEETKLLDFRLPASRPMRDKRLLSKLSYLWYFVRAAPTDKPIMTFPHVEINKGGLTHLAVKTCGKTLIP